MILTVYTDGGSLNNPGQAAYAYIIYKDGVLFTSFSERIGIASNNVAEYAGLIHSLEKILDLIKNKGLQTVEKINIYTDSNLMASQLNGLYKVKNARIREFVLRVRILESQIAVPIAYNHIYREKNQLADSLVKKALGKSHF